MKKKKKNSKTSIDLYEKNLQSLMDISKYIDEDNIYPPETQNSTIFIKLLFQDIRKCSKWYEHDEWRPIKAAIHNCYKLLQNGYVPENQIELENNIKILEILLKESNYKKSNVDKITEEVMQNIFDKTLKNLKENDNINIINNEVNDKNNNINNNINKNKIFEEDKLNTNNNNLNYINSNMNINNKNKDEYITKEKLDKIINEQILFYENKINGMQNEIDELKNKVNNLTDLMENIGSCFLNMKNNNNKKC
jgi:hypothetical protein